MSLLTVRGRMRLMLPHASRIVRCTSIRGFRPAMLSLRELKSRESHNENLKAEVKKLKNLKYAYSRANIIQRFILYRELTKQETRVSELQADSVGLALPEIKLKRDPLKVDNIKRCNEVFKFFLNTFVRECDAYAAGRGAFLNPDTLLGNLRDEFTEIHPDFEPPSNEDILYFFHLYYSLLNNMVFVDELKFDNSILNDLLVAYTSMDPAEDQSAGILKSSEDLDLDKEVVSGWFDVFTILSSVPFAKAGVRKTCVICPDEYARCKMLAKQFDAFQGKVSDVYKNISEHEKEKNSGVGGPSGSENKRNFKKSEKEPSNDQGQNKNAPKEFHINLNGSPMKFFQFGLLGGLLAYFIYSMIQEQEDEISFQHFISQFLSKNLVSRLIVVNNKTVLVELNENGKAQYGHQGSFYFNIGSIESFERSLRHVQDEYHIDEELRVPVIYTTEGSIAKMLVNFLPTLLFLGAIIYMSRKATSGGLGGPLGFGKSTAKKFNQESNVKTRFKDVAGMEEAKVEVMEFVDFLKHVEKYEKLGAKIPRGAILSGPPGTGKTLLARATAGEAGVPFFSVSGSEFVEMFVGVGASRVRDLFKTARENTPSIVFVDEIDAIGKLRSKGNASGANDERETTLNQLLVEMDGFDSSEHVVVLAGTNRADILDKALMRPGRFDRHITIDNPELEGRKEIFMVHLRRIKLEKDVDKELLGRLAALTPGFSGADIANVCNEAALIAARFNSEAVSTKHFELAIERVIGGIEKKNKLLSADEQKTVAYHEAGHAVCGWFLRHAFPLLKVSIIPRGQGALGYAQYLPPDQYLMSAMQLKDRMIMTLGGRVSEELHFESVTSGAHDDFKKVTTLAQNMVLRFGMSKEVGMVNYADTQPSDNLAKPYSDETNKIIDREIQAIVKDCYQRCTDLLKEKAEAVELVAQELLKKEFITREDMIRLLGKRPFPENNDAFDKYLQDKNVVDDENQNSSEQHA